MESTEEVVQSYFGAKLIGTAAVVAFALVLRAVAIRFVRRSEWRDDRERLAWLVRIRGATFLLVVLGLIVVWATQIQTFALSAIAVAAAIVIATKELIMCLSGGVLRAASEGYSVGDRIEVAGVRGDVIGYGMLTTTLLEVGPGHQRTGRALVLPNSLLLSQPVVNESFTQEYVLHVFSVPMRLEDDWRSAERNLLAAAEAVCADHVDAARVHMDRVNREHGLSPPSVEPRVVLQLHEAGQVRLLVRIPTPARDKARNEQLILRRLLEGAAPAKPAAG